MLKLGLLGKDIQHSKSKAMYDKIYNTSVDYQLLDYDQASAIPTLEEIFSNLRGLSITAPYKKHFLDNVEMTKEIRELGAINCIKSDTNCFYATNTDYLAVEEVLEELNFLDLNIIILGNGSMAAITKAILNKNNKTFTLLSRKEYGDLSSIDLSKFDKPQKMLVINSCSRAFEFSGTISNKAIFWDYNYSHSFHTKNLSKRCDYRDGLDLLYRQAIHATKFWDFSFL